MIEVQPRQDEPHAARRAASFSAGVWPCRAIREALDGVVVLLPGPSRALCLAVAGEALPARELLVVDAVAALDLPVLLRAPGPDVAVAVLDPGFFDRQPERQGKLVAVVRLELSYPEGKRALELTKEVDAVPMVQPAIEVRRAIPSADSFLTGSLSTAYTDAVPGWRRRSEEVVTEPGSSLDTRTFRGSVRAGTLLTRRRSPACLVYYSPYSCCSQ